MPSKRGKDGEQPEKMLISSVNKRVRRDGSTMTQNASVIKPTASTAVAIDRSCWFTSRI